MFTGPLDDRIAIRELIETYSDAVMRRDADAWAATWDEDAVWDLGAGQIRGKENMRATWSGLMETFQFVSFASRLGAIQVDGESASTRVYTAEFFVKGDGGTMEITGAYDDRLVKRDGRWLFQTRLYTILRQV